MIKKDVNFSENHTALAKRFPGSVISFEDETNNCDQTLHLYHAANSICSQKVRAVLAATKQTYVSHLLDIFQGHTYDPLYVRLRMSGCNAAGLKLVEEHVGDTSVTNSGCDACVVPTVVNATSDEVLVDSLHICLELDRRNPVVSNLLVPDAYRSEIKAELAIVDSLPNYQFLAVLVGKKSKTSGSHFSVSKVARCDDLMVFHAEDKILYDGYKAKRAKEQSAASQLFDEGSIAHAQDVFTEALRKLNARLPDKENSFLFGDTLTMADLFWGVELIRAEDLGLLEPLLSDELPKLLRYYQKLCTLPALRHAVIEWPGARLG